MNRLDPESLDFFNQEVVKMIVEKYHVTEMEALREFVKSETHRMLEDTKNDLITFSAGAVFDMFVTEKETGDPRNSVYIKED